MRFLDLILKALVRNHRIESGMTFAACAKASKPTLDLKTLERILKPQIQLLPTHRTALINAVQDRLHITPEQLQLAASDPHNAVSRIIFGAAGRRLPITAAGLTEVAATAKCWRAAVGTVSVYAASLSQLFTQLELVTHEVVDNIVQPPYPTLNLILKASALRNLRQGGDDDSEHPLEALIGMVSARIVRLTVVDDASVSASPLAAFASVSLLDQHAAIVRVNQAYGLWRADDGVVEAIASQRLRDDDFGGLPRYAVHPPDLGPLLSLLRKQLPKGCWSRRLTPQRALLARTYTD